LDEISVRKGQKYLTVVVDHHTGRLVWAAYGRDRKTVEKFLDLLGKERCEEIELVSCDDAEWITRPVAERCPGAQSALTRSCATRRYRFVRGARPRRRAVAAAR
jgi:transposase